MKKATSCLDRIIILCRNIESTSAIYSQSLGLKIVLQSPQLVQMRDAGNIKIFLKTVKQPYQIPKGYSPILSFRVEYFDQIYQKLKKCQNVLQDGPIIETQKGKIANFMGPQGQHISINSFSLQETHVQNESESSLDEFSEKSSKQIKNLLNKLKI